MKFSVIVPVFRVEKYLEECLDSIRRQTYKDFECVVVDDGSDDSSPQICDTFAQNDKRFKVIHKSNGGLVSARKAGAEAAMGEYVVCVDGDDFVDGSLLEKLSAIIEEHAPDTIIYGANTYKNAVEKSFCSNVKPGYYEGKNLGEILQTFMYDPQQKGINDGNILFYMWCKCVRRSLYHICQEDVDDTVVSGEDTLFTLTWTKNVVSAFFTDYCGYYYCSNGESLERTFKTDCMDKLDFLTAEMRRISPEFSKKINIFYCFRALKLCLLAAQQLGYSEYMKFVKKQMNKDRMCIIRSAALNSHTSTSYIKHQLLKKKMWRTLYILANTWFAGKFS